MTTPAADPGQEFPMIAVPDGFQGTDAEAVGLAVAGALAGLEKERNALRVAAEEAVGTLGALLAVFPETGWAQSEIQRERATEVHARLATQLWGPESGS